MPVPDPPICRNDPLEEVLAECQEAIEAESPTGIDALLACHPEYRREIEDFVSQNGWANEQLRRMRDRKPDARTISFAGYQLLEVIGQGGMGIVYRAQQKNPNRVVALKRINSGRLATAVERQRFFTEVEALSRLDHPNIVPVYEVGEAENNPYYTMRFLEGGSLISRLPELRQNSRECARLIATLAKAVHHAHERGVLHRDLKPGNILIDAAQQPHASDFGLAKLTENAEQTKTGELLGTPSYMSPEQANGTRNGITFATDVYGLGAVLYACLTGRPPFEAGTMVEILEQVRDREPLSPSRLNAAVPRDLNAICLKCLQKEPSRRYASADALSKDLECFLEGVTVQARQTTAPEKCWRWMKRRPGLTALMTIACALLIAFIVSLIAYQVKIDGVNQDLTQAMNASRDAERKARQHLYATELFVASKQFEDGDFGESRMNLSKLLDPGMSEFREFAWRHLWYESRRMPRVEMWTGHRGAVEKLAVAPDQSRVVSVGIDATVRMWDPASGRLTHTIAVPRSNISGLEYSEHDSRYYVTLGGTDPVVLAIHPDGTSTEAVRLQGEVRGVALVPTTTSMIVLTRPDKDWFKQGYPWTLVEYDLATGQQSRVLLRGFGASDCIAVSRDGEWVAVGGSRDPLPPEIRNTGEGPGSAQITVLHRLKGEIRTIRDATPDSFTMWSFSPNGKSLAVTNGREWVAQFNLENGERIWERSLFDKSTANLRDHVIVMTYHRVGSMLAVGHDDASVRILDTSSGEIKWTRQFDSNVRTVAWMPRGTVLLIGLGRDHAIYHWQVTGAASRPIPLGDEGWALAFSPDSEYAVVGCDTQIQNKGLKWVNASLIHRNKKTGKLESPLLSDPDVEQRSMIAALAVSADGQNLYTASFDKTISAWNITARQQLWSIRVATQQTLRSIAISPDGRTIAVGDRGGLIHLVDPVTGTTRFTLNGHNGKKVNDLVFLKRSDQLASGGNDGRVLIWDLTTRQSRVLTSMNEMHAIALHPVHPWLTVAGKSGVITTWDLTNHQEIMSIRAKNRYVYALAYNPDGTTLASGADDGVVRLWHTATGQPLASLRGHTGPVYALAFDSGGSNLASTGADKTVRFWRTDKTLP